MRDSHPIRANVVCEEAVGEGDGARASSICIAPVYEQNGAKVGLSSEDQSISVEKDIWRTLLPQNLEPVTVMSEMRL